MSRSNDAGYWVERHGPIGDHPNGPRDACSVMLVGVAEPALQHGELQQLDSPIEAKFAHAIGLVDFDGLDDNVQPLGDFLIAVPLRAQPQDCQFTVGY